MKILMIGPLPPPVGGARVLFLKLVERVSCINFVDVVELRPVRRQIFTSIKHMFSQVVDIVMCAKKSDVVTLHTSMTALHIRGVVIKIICGLCDVPYIVHTFGGVLYGEEYGPLRVKMINFSLRGAHCYLAETQAQVEHAKAQGIGDVIWFPNMRDRYEKEDLRAESSFEHKRFVFISHVSVSKGILELVQAAEQFDEAVVVDVYGPFREGACEKLFIGCENARYKGVLEPDSVMGTLAEYDVLLLPTKCDTEGYPGIIIEAYMAGIPVITTKCGKITEIVDKSSGLFVEPSDVDSLFQAMNEILGDSCLYEKLKQGAIDKQQIFDSRVWANKFVKICADASS